MRRPFGVRHGTKVVSTRPWPCRTLAAHGAPGYGRMDAPFTMDNALGGKRLMTQAQRIACLVAGLLGALGFPAAAQTSSTDAWTWRATIYVWLPSINGTTNFKGLPGDGNIDTDANPGGYLSRLQFAFMGTLEARQARGPWGVYGDAIYLNFGNHTARIKSIGGPGGNVSIPIDLGTTTNLEGFVGTLGGEYALLQQPNARADVVAGIRYATIKTSLDWDLSGPAGAIPPTGSKSARTNLTDGIVGARGSYDLSRQWFIPWYADVGAGSSRLTWQAMAGIGYRFGWGDLTLAYRHLAYDFHNNRIASDITFSGPAVAASFNF